MNQGFGQRMLSPQQTREAKLLSLVVQKSPERVAVQGVSNETG